VVRNSRKIGAHPCFQHINRGTPLLPAHTSNNWHCTNPCRCLFARVTTNWLSDLGCKLAFCRLGRLASARSVEKLSWHSSWLMCSQPAVCQGTRLQHQSPCHCTQPPCPSFAHGCTNSCGPQGADCHKPLVHLPSVLHQEPHILQCKLQLLEVCHILVAHAWCRPCTTCAKVPQCALVCQPQLSMLLGRCVCNKGSKKGWKLYLPDSVPGTHAQGSS
jgi:hypothetical protein